MISLQHVYKSGDHTTFHVDAVSAMNEIVSIYSSARHAGSYSVTVECASDDNDNLIKAEIVFAFADMIFRKR